MQNKTSPILHLRILACMALLLSISLTGALVIYSSPAYAGDESTNDTTPDDKHFTDVADVIHTNTDYRKVTATRLVGELQDGFSALADAIKKAVTEEIKQQEVSRSGSIPDGENRSYLLQTYNGGMVAATTQERNFDDSSLQYLTSNTKILGKANPYLNGALSATANLFKNYVKYFCIVGARNAPNGCGSAAIDGGYFAPNLAQNIIGERTFSPDTMDAASDFVRAYFGISPDKIDTSRAQLGSYVDQQRDLARINLRLSVLNRLMARRTPMSGGDNTSLAGALFKIYYQNGLIATNHPQALCSRPLGELQPLELVLCSAMNKNYNTSAAVADRMLQYDYYINPAFMENIYSHEQSPNGSLLRLEVAMKAQQLAQDYRYLQDLQMYTAMRASALTANIK